MTRERLKLIKELHDYGLDHYSEDNAAFKYIEMLGECIDEIEKLDKIIDQWEQQYQLEDKP